MKTDETIIFQHIPKAAGSTLNTLLLAQFQYDLIFNCGHDGVLHDFLEFEQQKRDSYRLLIGHVDFGIHAYFTRTTTYFTFVRDPVERVVSHYYFIKNAPSHRYHKKAQEMDIKAFIESGIRPRMNNCMTRMISGLEAEYNQCKPSMLNKALENLAHSYCFVGFVERFEESVEKLCSIFGWDTTAYTVSNVTPNRPAVQDLPADVVDCIVDHNALDIQLYDYLKEYSDVVGSESSPH